MGKDIIRVYKCEKCNLTTTTTNKELDKFICKNCGGTLKFDYQYYHNSKNGLNAINMSKQYKNNNVSFQQFQQQNIPHCPICGSAKLSKISTLNRAVSASLFGIFSKKIGKQWHCNQCGTDF